MRDLETIEDELTEISTIADDSIRLERIIAWCTLHPNEVPFALHQFVSLHRKHSAKSAESGLQAG